MQGASSFNILEQLTTDSLRDIGRVSDRAREIPILTRIYLFSVRNLLGKISAMETNSDSERRGCVLNTTETIVNPMDIPNNSSPLLLQNESPTPMDIMMGFIPGTNNQTPGQDDRGVTQPEPPVS